VLIQRLSAQYSINSAEFLQRSVAFFTKTHFFVSNVLPYQNTDRVLLGGRPAPGDIYGISRGLPVAVNDYLQSLALQVR
jgi:hypothetical protein